MAQALQEVGFLLASKIVHRLHCRDFNGRYHHPLCSLDYHQQTLPESRSTITRPINPIWI
ncbi:MAG: hypothetical protein GDA67_15970 [Nitrospira sp. CR1.3]|nr:hypothetical protein [Nitrospira sp. CR1.3]